MPGLLDTLFPIIGAQKSRRERREMENALLRDSMDARNEMVDLLGRQVPVRGPGQQIPAVVPENAQQIGMPAVNIPGMRGIAPAYQTPQGQQEMIQLMSRMGPDGMQAAMGAAMPQTNERTNTMQQKINALISEAQRRGYSPEQANEFIDENLAGGTDPIMAMLQAERLEQQRLANQGATLTAEQGAEQKRIDRASKSASIRSTLRGVEDIASNNEFLTETVLRPGYAAQSRKSGLSLWETIKRTAGGDTTREQQILQAYGDFEKGAANLLNDLLPNLEGINANTDARLGQIKKSLADVGNEPGTNAKILSETIYDILDIADINNYEIPSEDKWLGLAQNLREFNRAGTGRTVVMPDGTPVNNVPLSVTDDEMIRRYEQRQ